MVSSSTKLAIIAGLVLIAVGSYAAYTSYKESELMESKLMTFGAGQSKAWILANPSETAALMTDSNASVVHMTQEDLVRYPTLKAYISYFDSNPGTRPLNSMSIDPLEARLLLFLVSQRFGNDVKPQPDSPIGVWYILLVEISGHYYGINIVFDNERPILD